MVLAMIGCGDSDRPSPALAERHDVVIAFCEERLESTTDFCDRVQSSSGDAIVANVLFGRAGGHEVSVEVEVVDGGSLLESAPSSRVPTDRSFLHAVEIPRAGACAEPSCRLEARAYVDGILVLSDQFTFE